MADKRTQYLYGRHRFFKKYALPALLAILAALGEIYYGFNGKDVIKEVLSGYYIELKKSVLVNVLKYNFIMFVINWASGPIAIWLLLVTLENYLPFSNKLMDWLFPDPPHFGDSDIENSKKLGKTLLEMTAPQLVGRESELIDIGTMLSRQDGCGFAWRTLYGVTGVGKTRLSLEWLAQARSQAWDIAYIPARDAAKLENWRPRKPTALVFDEIARDWPDVFHTLAMLQSVATAKRPIRVLLVDQFPPKTTHRLPDIQQALIDAQAAPALCIEGLDRAAMLRLCQEAEYVGPLSLGEFVHETNGVPRMALLLCRFNGARSLREAMESWVGHWFPTELGGTFPQQFGADFGGPLALAILAGEIATDDVRTVTGSVDTQRLQRYYDHETADSLNARLPPVEPRDLAQYALLRILHQSDAGQRQAWFDLALAAYPERVETCLGDLWQYYPDADIHAPRDDSEKILAWMQLSFDRACPDRIDAFLVLGGSLLDATANTGQTSQAFDAALIDLDRWALRRPYDPSVWLIQAKAHTNATGYYGRVASAQDARGQAPDWSGLTMALARLDALAVANDATPDIRLQCAMGHRNATAHCGNVAVAQDARGQAPDWSGLTMALARLDALAVTKDATPAIRLECAKGHYNAATCYGNVAEAQDARGQAPDWSGLTMALARLDALADARDATPDIRLQCSKGHRNATGHYGNVAVAQDALGRAPDWSGLTMALARLDALADARDATPDIRLQCAMGHRNATGHYGNVASAQDARGQAPDWSGLTMALTRLDALADAKDATPDIRLECATGHRNATVDYGRVALAQDARGQAPDWSGLTMALARLDTLAQSHPLEVELVIKAFTAIAAAEGIFGKARAIAAAATQRQRLKRYGWAYPLQPKIQGILQQHFPHLTYGAQMHERERSAAEKAKFDAAR